MPGTFRQLVGGTSQAVLDWLDGRLECASDQAVASAQTGGRAHCYGCDRARVPGSGPAESLKRDRAAPADGDPQIARGRVRVLALIARRAAAVAEKHGEECGEECGEE